MKASYVVQRILYAVLIFAIVVALDFFIPRIGVSDPAERLYPPQGAMSDIEYELVKEFVKEKYGFDVSTGQQFINYVKNLLKGDLGTSYQSGSPKVTELIGQRLPWTLALSVTNMIISAVTGIILGTFVATKRGRWQDNVLLGAANVSVALPAFFIALVLSLYLGFEWGIFPAYTETDLVSTFGWNIQSIIKLYRNMAIPIISMSIGGIIGYSVSTRNSVIAVSNEDYVLTARAKGLSQRTILYKHILRNALLPIVTSIGMSISGLVGGAVVIEKIFNWNGMGTLFLNANNDNDYPLMMGIMLFLSSISIVANLITDLCYSVLDPRTAAGGRH